MNDEKNRGLSVVETDDPICADGLSVNDELIALRLSMRNLGDDFRALAERTMKLADLGAKLDKIGGSLPYNLKAAFAGVDPLDREMSDEDFVMSMLKIEKSNPDPIQAALAFGNFAKKILGEMAKCQHRIEKLCERTRADKRGPEFENAKRMKQIARDALAVLERRLGIVLNGFFKSRNRSIDGITRVTTAVYRLFPDGSAIARQAYLANMNDSISTFKTFDDRLAFGETKQCRKTVRI